LAAIGVLGLAQAAAIFIAVALSWHPSTTSRLPQVADKRTSTPSSSVALHPTAVELNVLASVPPVEIEEGWQVVIHLEGSSAKVVDLTPQGTFEAWPRSGQSDDWLDMFNQVESMPNTTIAMKE